MFDHLDPELMMQKRAVRRFTPEEIENMILYEVDREKHLVRIIFNRPETKNAMPLAAFPRLFELFRKAELDVDVRVIILKSNGDHFGSGADAGELGGYIGFGDGTTEKEKRRPTQIERMWPDRQLIKWENDFKNCTKIIIAQVHGYCYGEHLTWADMCDIVVASEDALFTHPAWRFIGPGQFRTGLLLEAVGLRKAQEMQYTGRPLTAPEAEKCGLITKCVPRARLEQEVEEYAAAVVARPMDGLAMGKLLFEMALLSRGTHTDDIQMRVGHVWKTNLSYFPGEWNFLKRRRDLDLTSALEEVDMRVAPRFRHSYERRRLP